MPATDCAVQRSHNCSQAGCGHTFFSQNLRADGHTTRAPPPANELNANGARASAASGGAGRVAAASSRSLDGVPRYTPPMAHTGKSRTTACRRRDSSSRAPNNARGVDLLPWRRASNA